MIINDFIVYIRFIYKKADEKSVIIELPG